ncbi:MAG TPA: hypothetical protein VN363_01080 [Anaerolineales bacterium]|nr:hypothetical protein [Anaerolineales bacterium]
MLKLRSFLYPLLGGSILVLALALTDLPLAIAQEPERVGLVIQFADETVVASCIDISGQEPNGYDILQLAGLDLGINSDANQDIAVCSVNGQGCDANHCFCQFPDYWSYWHTEGNEWIYSGRGASTYKVKPGTVEGWRWGSGIPPAPVSFEQICSTSAPDFISGPTVASEHLSPGVLLKPVNGVDSIPGSRSSSPDASKPVSLQASIGYIVFGFALLGMGVGLFIVAKTERS